MAFRSLLQPQLLCDSVIIINSCTKLKYMNTVFIYCIYICIYISVLAKELLKAWVLNKHAVSLIYLLYREQSKHEFPLW